MTNKLILFGCFLSLTASTLFGQGLGTILGTVQDPSGLGVPNVKVTALMVERGLTRTVNTEATGEYVFTLMPVGTYTVTVEQQGFRAFRQAGIALAANANARVDVKLEVGSVVQQVSVTGATTAVDTHSSVVGELIDERQITELPTDGRNVISLAVLLPGVTALYAPQVLTNEGAGALVSIEGGRQNQNLYLFDGVEFQALFINSGLNYPPPDALQEVKVLANAFSAEYGHNAGSIFNVVTKSGTDHFHGAGWEFLRNSDLNARNFFSSSVPTLIQNQFGGNIGGPIKKDKLFFFGSYEGLRIRQQALSSGVFPLTVQEREGYFTTPITDPQTGDNFPTATCPITSGTCYVIPPSRFDTVAKNVLGLGSMPAIMPLPNEPGGAWEGTYPTPTNSDQVLVRGDYNTSKHTITARYNYNHSYTTAFDGSIPAYQPYASWMTVQSAMLGDTWVIRPNLLNEVRLGLNRIYDYAPILNPTSLSELGGNFPTLEAGQTVGFSIAGRVNQGSGCCNTDIDTDQTMEFRDSISWTKGRHVVKAGFMYLRNFEFNQSFWETAPSFTYSGYATGNSAADFLLGLPSQLLFATPIFQQAGNETSTYYYVQDDWKVSKRLTLNLGLRYELPLPWVQPNNWWGTLHVGQQSTVFPTAPVGLVYPGDKGVPRGIVPTPNKDFAPRIGFAWDPFGKGRTSVRGAYGIFYDATNTQIIQNFLEPFRYSVYIKAPYSTTNALLGQPAVPIIAAVNTRNPVFTTGPQDLLWQDPTYVTPYVEHYNLNVQHEFTKDLMVQVGYYGKTFQHLWMGYNSNPAFYNCPGCPVPTLANENQRLVLEPGFDVPTIENSTRGSGRYNGLEIEVHKRFSHGFQAQGTYTYNSTIDNSSELYLGPNVPNPFNFQTQWGPSDTYNRHIASISWLWDLPKVTGSNPALRTVANGWESTGLIAVNSGFPIDVMTGEDNALSGTPDQRPDQVGSPYLASGRSKGDWLQQEYNYQAYANPVPGPGPNDIGVYGNVGRNSLIGPGAFTTNMGIFKTFLVREDVRLQFRSEFFNLFNRANFNNPNGVLASGVNMFTIGSASPSRQIQFALKVLF
jgi:outer membrane receptor protein involved in Fe transport